MATNTPVNVKVGDTPETEGPKSVGEPIPSISVQKFYDEGGRLIDKDRPYVYQPKEGLPYPWPVLRPVDDKLADELREEYTKFQAKKMKEIDSRSSIRGTFERLANLRDE